MSNEDHKITLQIFSVCLFWWPIASSEHEARRSSVISVLETWFENCLILNLSLTMINIQVLKNSKLFKNKIKNGHNVDSSTQANN